MKTLISLLAAACLAGAAFAQASNPPPAPGPEAQKMSVGYGEWTYEGAYQATPLGPAEKFTGRMSGRPVLNGFTGEFAYREKSDSRETEQLELNWYDPAARSYSYVVPGSDGYIEEGPFAFNGNVCTWEAKGVADGTPFKIRGTETMAPDKMSLIREAEISMDGKTWLPYLKSKYTKVKPRSDGQSQLSTRGVSRRAGAWPDDRFRMGYPPAGTGGYRLCIAVSPDARREVVMLRDKNAPRSRFHRAWLYDRGCPTDRADQLRIIRRGHVPKPGPYDGTDLGALVGLR